MKRLTPLMQTGQKFGVDSNLGRGPMPGISDHRLVNHGLQPWRFGCFGQAATCARHLHEIDLESGI